MNTETLLLDNKMDFLFLLKFQRMDPCFVLPDFADLAWSVI